MNQQAAPKSSKTASAVILFLVVIAGGWLYLNYFQGNRGGDSGLAFEAKEKMLSRQSEADAAGASSLAEDTYIRGVEFAQQGDKEFEEGNYAAAKISYSSAADYFTQSVDEATENLTIAAEREEEAKLREPASAAKAEMLELKAQAAQAGGQTSARASFNRALQEEQQAEQEFESGDYASATLSFQKAGELFKSSRNEAHAKAIDQEADLSIVKRVVESMRQEMLKEKAMAEQSESRTMATELFENAQIKERAGDNNFRAGTRDGYSAAQATYAEARDGYRNAKEAARAKALEEADKEKKREEALRAEAERTRLRKEADAARADMEAARNKIGGSPSDKEASQAFQDALRMRQIGEEQYQAEDYRLAGNSFQQAERLYLRASEEISSASENKKNTADDGAKAAADAEKRAREEIDGLINSYRRSLERGDIDSMRAFDKNLDEIQWARVFRNAENVTVSIREKTIEVTGDKAYAFFKFNMSFLNTSKNSKEEYPLSREWRLEKMNGQWKIVSSR